MSGLLYAETTKLLRRRLPFGLLAGVVGYLALTLVALPLVLRLTPEGTQGSEGLDALISTIKAPAGYVFAAQVATSTSALFVAVLAAIAMGNEYSWGTMALTLSREPRRGRVLAGKLAALGLVAAAISLVAWLAGLLLVVAVQPLLPAGTESAAIDGSWPLVSTVTWLKGLPSLAVWITIAVTLGIVTRSPAAAAGITVGLTFGESFLALAPVVRDFLITPNVQALQNVPGMEARTGLGAVPGGIAPTWRALVVLAAWFALFTAWGWRVLRRRDV